MATINTQMAQDATTFFKQDLEQLTSQEGDAHKSKACVICDRLLEWNETGIIPIARLYALRKLFLGRNSILANMHSDIKVTYAYKGNGKRPWMHDMFLSPRGYYHLNETAFQCCLWCEKQLNTKMKPS